jgi:hypothetical protein
VPQATCLRNGQPQTRHLAVFTPHTSHKRIKRGRRRIGFLRSTDSADTSAHARTYTGYEFTSTSSVVATHEQRNCWSSGKVLRLQIALDRLGGEISPVAKSWTTNAGLLRGVSNGSPVLRLQRRRSARGHTTKVLSAFAGSLNQRRLANYDIGRDVGEPDATASDRSIQGNTKERRTHDSK